MKTDRTIKIWANTKLRLFQMGYHAEKRREAAQRGVLQNLTFENCRGDQENGRDRDCILLRRSDQGRTENLILSGICGQNIDTLLDAGDCRHLNASNLLAVNAGFAAVYLNNHSLNNLVSFQAVRCRWGLLTKGQTGENWINFSEVYCDHSWVAARDSVLNYVRQDGTGVTPAILEDLS